MEDAVTSVSQLAQVTLIVAERVPPRHGSHCLVSLCEVVPLLFGTRSFNLLLWFDCLDFLTVVILRVELRSTRIHLPQHLSCVLVLLHSGGGVAITLNGAVLDLVLSLCEESAREWEGVREENL
jgi:hypothetical protein